MPLNYIFPKLLNFTIACSDGPLGTLSFNSNTKTIYPDKWNLMPSLVDGILHVDRISARFKPSLLPEYHSGNDAYFNLKTVVMQIYSPRGITMLQDTINKIDISGNKNDELVNVDFIGTRSPLFKIDNTSIMGKYKITFMIGGIGSSGIPFGYDLVCNFQYKPFPRYGDVNGDGVVDILDVVTLANHITMGSDVPYISGAKKIQSEEIDTINLMRIAKRALNE